MAKRGTSDGWVSEMGKSKRERGKRGRGGISKGRVPGRHAAQAAALVGDGGSADCWCSFAPPFFFFFFGMASAPVSSSCLPALGLKHRKCLSRFGVRDGLPPWRRKPRWEISGRAGCTEMSPFFFRAPLVYSDEILAGRLAEQANTAGERGKPEGVSSSGLGRKCGWVRVNGENGWPAAFAVYLFERILQPACPSSRRFVPRRG